ncbi:hypothetical protein ACFYN3_42220 [Streptomyces lavendulae]
MTGAAGTLSTAIAAYLLQTDDVHRAAVLADADTVIFWVQKVKEDVA